MCDLVINSEALTGSALSQVAQLVVLYLAFGPTVSLMPRAYQLWTRDLCNKAVGRLDMVE
jgi:hypothetical protein